MKKDKATRLTVLGVLLAAFTCVFGSIFQGLTSKSFSDYLFQATSTPRSGIIPWKVESTTYADLRSWLPHSVSTPAPGEEPYLVSCLLRASYTNSDNKTIILANILTTINVGAEKVSIDNGKNPSVLQKQALSPFSCIEVSLIKQEPKFEGGIPYIEIPTEFLALIPTPTFNPDEEFYVFPPQEVTDCSANPDVYYDRARLEFEPAGLPYSLSDPFIQYFILTRFYLKPEVYSSSSTPANGFLPVRIEQKLLDDHGAEFPLPPNLCFYVARK